MARPRWRPRAVGLDGYRVAEALRREPAFVGVRLIAISGYGQAEDRKRAQAAGFDLHLVKPVDFGELISALSAK
jgi:CheY-like chemotaxis protein